MHRRQSLPGLTTVRRTENIAELLALRAPGRGIHDIGPFGIRRDVVQDVLVARAKMRKASPVLPTVVRYKNHARARPQENPIRVMRIVGQAADIASVRTQHRPLASPSRQTAGQHNRHYNQQLTSLGSENHVCKPLLPTVYVAV